MKDGVIGSCYLLVGEDSWSKNQFITDIKNKILAPADEMMNYFEIKDQEVTTQQLIDMAETLPFFTDRKIIYIKDTIFFKTGKKEETERFEAFIKELPEYNVLIIDERDVDKRSKLYKTIQGRHTVMVFDYPGEEKVLNLLEVKAQEMAVDIDTATLRYFLRNMPEDITYILGEFNKLANFAENTKVTQQAIESVCVFSLEKRIFELVKKIAHRNAQEAFQIYHTLIQSKESPIGILVLIARQYRIMLQIKYLLKNRTSSKAIASQLKLPYFALKEMIEQVDLYTFKQLEEILEKCLIADKDIKTGKMNSVERVEVLMIQCLNA